VPSGSTEGTRRGHSHWFRVWVTRNEGRKRPQIGLCSGGCLGTQPKREHTAGEHVRKPPPSSNELVVVLLSTAKLFLDC
jgi:hypothetical protein